MSDERGIYHPHALSPAPRSNHVLLLLGLLLLATVPVIAVAEPKSPTPANEMQVVGTDALHLRECPSMTCRTAGSVPLGTAVELTGEGVDGFLPVTHDGRELWAWHVFLNDGTSNPMLRKGIAGCDRVAIIFNAGIGATPSSTILETLGSTQVPVTVFAMGWWADAYPDYLRQLDTETRAIIGTHGNSQSLPTSLSDDEIAAEVQDSMQRIESVLGYPIARYFTPYAMDTDERVDRIVAQQGFLPVGWTVAGADYGDNDSEQAVQARALKNVTDGAIIELHLDGPSTEQSTARALPAIIEELQQRGFTLASIPEIVLPCPPSP